MRSTTLYSVFQDGWNLRHQKSINAKLDYYRQLFINWPGRVVKLAVCTRCSYLHTLQVQTLIMSQEMTIFEKYLVSIFFPSCLMLLGKYKDAENEL
jgi:hypothetical protein